MSSTRVDALAEARRALRGMELAIRKARFHRAGPLTEDAPPLKARRSSAITRACNLRKAG
ncbi:MAG: hypothetical protein QGI75_01185 [Phycisphaerales bacterium]|nr:hypothetical protein [Phycisphaerales bacterium]MDP6890478.1 hypothetical protein [Phycisphaerales bacterium]